MDVELTCPLGAKCEEIRDNKLYRCYWYTQLKGKDPQSEKIVDEMRCAIAWMPVLSVEMAQTNRGQTAALESFRNEAISQQDRFNSLVEDKANGKNRFING